ncbi:MAG: glycosyltransferase [Lachnospiraceae bacterium]|nr:glycosyltransferase [Lachnospiraceae bacterium]
MKESLISIIVPVYNIERYLDDCINSIVNQSYKNTEIILIDDGSTDESGKICDKWKETDPRIVVIHKDNEGLSAARNTGIITSKGEYIAFVDGDDKIHFEYIKLLYDCALKYKSEISVCEVFRFWNDDEVNLSAESDDVGYTKLDSDSVWLEFFKGDSVADMNVSWNKLYDTRLFETIRFPVGRLHEDIATTYKLLFEASGVVIVHKELYFYRQRDDSIVHKKMTLNRCKDYIVSQNERMDFFQKNLPKFYYSDLKYELNAVFNNSFYFDNPQREQFIRQGLLIFAQLKNAVPFAERLRLYIALHFPGMYIFYLNIKRRII